MSELRKQLESAREAHRAARYPGDLAAEVMPPRMSLWKIAAQSAVVAAAVAAVVLLVFRVPDLTVQPQTDSQALAPADPTLGVALTFPALPVPRVPDEFASPATPSLSFAAPSFPAMSLRIELEATFKESI